MQYNRRLIMQIVVRPDGEK